jgi:Tfp pilus assembly protein PilF
MTRTALALPLFLLMIWGSSAQAAQKGLLKGAEDLFEKGAYAQSVAAAEKIRGGDRKLQAEVALLLAAAHSKMQAFDKALPYFERAERLGSSAPNLYYDYGQALFATQKLREAEAQFRKSIVARFKTAASAYYVGYIRQLLEDRDAAKDFYSRIQRLSSDPEEVKQPALFQLAELEFDHYSKEENKERRLRLLQAKVLPLYKEARDYAKGTPAHDQANLKIAEIERELEEITHRMVNGNPIAKKPYTLRLSQDFAYDSNVITEADGALIQVSDKDSFLSKTALLARYELIWKRTFSFTPELMTSATFHSRRSTPRVFQNDNIVIAPAMRSKWEHWSRGKPATGLMDLEFNLMLRDYEQQHKFPMFTRTWSLTLGERVTWFPTGSTTLKAGIRFTENYNPDRNAYSPSISLQQNVKIAGKYDLQNTISADYMHARNDFNDERNYKVRHNVTLTNLFWKVDVTPSLSVNLKDTMKQRETRGNEVLVNPSLAFSRPLGGGLDSSLEYAFSKNFSRSKELYQYRKHEAKMGLAYRF